MIEIPRIEGGYRTILADPAWPYKQKLISGKARGGAEKHYEVMTIDDIQNLPVGSVAAKDCQLWLWTTNTHLHSAFHAIEHWGFTFKTCCTWVKGHVEGNRFVIQFGLGYWMRGATEHLLLAVKGNPREKFNGPNGATGLNYSTVIFAERGEHSAKPEASYRMIEAMGEEPRLELFARKRREGWTQWGLGLESELQARIDLVKSE